MGKGRLSSSASSSPPALATRVELGGLPRPGVRHTRALPCRRGSSRVFYARSVSEWAGGGRGVPGACFFFLPLFPVLLCSLRFLRGQGTEEFRCRQESGDTRGFERTLPPLH